MKELIFWLISLSQLPGCDSNDFSSFQGYIEGEYLYLAAPEAGYLKTLDIQRGSRVLAGQTAFVIGDDPSDQALVEAEFKAESAKRKLQNLKLPKRPTEIAALEANLKAAEANKQLAQIQLEQQETLIRQHFVSKIKVDEARSAYQQSVAEVEAIQKQIATYKNTLGRQSEIQAAAADLEASNAVIAQKRWTVEHKIVTVPAIGEINETYYQPGEWVAAGAPVASLLPDKRRRVRFFVPEQAVAAISIGKLVEANCDGCSAPIRAKVNFVSPLAEYTPPVIYSRGSREKLVFRVEAEPDEDQAGQLRPGLPVDVRFVP